MSFTTLIYKQQQYFKSGITRNIDFRISNLTRLHSAIIAGEADILRALQADLNKSEYEAYSTEIGIVLADISHTIKHLKKWAHPRKVKTALTHVGSKGYIVPEPYGSTLIISPWNYPFQLALSPLIGAIAAGNTAVLKPSELSPAVSSLLSTMLSSLYPEDYVAVVLGAAEESKALLELPFDKIFFTGSTQVGKIVMAAAANHLTPVTLELGGKSPCIVHHDASLEVTAKRIVFGKFTNAGQTCIAPDYLIVHHSIKQRLIEELQKSIHELYGAQPLDNPNYTKIISRKHFDRITAYLSDGNPIVGGQVRESSLTIAPTLLDQVNIESPVMKDEIFGPILPILEYDDIAEVIEQVNARPKPLALYLFTSNSALQKLVINRVSYGGGCINDTLMHVATPYLPFGGVGHSGTGSYHGVESFRTFSHMKSVLKQTTKFDIKLRYPSSKNGLAILRRLMNR